MQRGWKTLVSLPLKGASPQLLLPFPWVPVIVTVKSWFEQEDLHTRLQTRCSLTAKQRTWMWRVTVELITTSQIYDKTYRADPTPSVVYFRNRRLHIPHLNSLPIDLPTIVLSTSVKFEKLHRTKLVYLHARYNCERANNTHTQTTCLPPNSNSGDLGFLTLFRQQYSLNVGQHSTLSNSHTVE